MTETNTHNAPNNEAIESWNFMHIQFYNNSSKKRKPATAGKDNTRMYNFYYSTPTLISL